MPKRAEKKIVKPEYQKGQRVVLKNTWALSVDPEGLKAYVRDHRINKEGDIIYHIEAWRPPIPCSVKGEDLEPEKADV